MTSPVVADIVRDALFMVLRSALPVLLVSLSIGLIISIFQTVTSIQEQTLTFIPKIVGVFLSIALLGPWMMRGIVNFTIDLWSNFSLYVDF